MEEPTEKSWIMKCFQKATADRKKKKKIQLGKSVHFEPTSQVYASPI